MIYLDQAATSFPKPKPVLEAVRRWFEELGVSADRGDSRLCAEVAGEVRAARTGIARLCGVPAERVAFTSGATEGLNLLLRATLAKGDAVLTTDIEHSSLARPLLALGEEIGITVRRVPCDPAGRVAPDAIAAALRAMRFRLVAFSHASNVTGAVLDAAAICASARELGVASLLDASASAGLLPLAVGADMVVASAHKHLHAPPGLGFVAVRPGLALRSVKQGGTGSARALDRHPTEWPTAFEAGTPNSPAILGLAAALRWLEGRSESLLRDGLARIDELREALTRRSGVAFQSPGPESERIPVLSVTLADLDPSEAGALLADAGIHVRTGFHCAPWIHERLGTSRAGTVRFSPGPQISAAQIQETARALSG
jgi:selenocysteine lyase/cysteine desulfurase